MRNCKSFYQRAFTPIESGFTLIEILVVIVVLMSTGIVIGAILFSSLRGASKANILTTAQQNGDYAMSQMVKTIRNAKSFGGVSIDEPETNDTGWLTDCSESELTHYRYVKITSPSNEEIVYSCKNESIFFNAGSLIDESLVKTKEGSCYFTCTQNNPTESPTIGINFTLVQTGNTTSVEKAVSLPFSTSVRMRNSLR